MSTHLSRFDGGSKSQSKAYAIIAPQTTKILSAVSAACAEDTERLYSSLMIAWRGAKIVLRHARLGWKVRVQVEVILVSVT
jgi:hypothetical protein